MEHLSWDDLRIVLAVARAGSVRGAARTLDVHHATVSRRLAAMARQLEARPFEREGRRLIPSEVGFEIIEAAERLERQVLDLERRVHGRDTALRGTVRVSLGYAFLHALSDIAAKLARELPDVRIEWVGGVSLSSLARREADIAVRVTREPQETLLGRRVSALAVGAYGTTDHASSARARWVTWDQADNNPASAWVAENVTLGAVVATADSPWALYELVAGGVGVGFVPRVLGDACPTLMRITATPEFLTDIWVLTHEDSRENSRVRAVMQVLGDAIASRNGMFRGVQQSGP